MVFPTVRIYRITLQQLTDQDLQQLIETEQDHIRDISAISCSERHQRSKEHREGQADGHKCHFLIEIVIGSQSYKRNLVLKKSKLVLNSLTVCYLTLR